MLHILHRAYKAVGVMKVRKVIFYFGFQRVETAVASQISGVGNSSTVDRSSAISSDRYELFLFELKTFGKFNYRSTLTFWPCKTSSCLEGPLWPLGPFLYTGTTLVIPFSQQGLRSE